MVIEYVRPIQANVPNSSEEDAPTIQRTRQETTEENVNANEYENSKNNGNPENDGNSKQNGNPIGNDNDNVNPEVDAETNDNANPEVDAETNDNAHLKGNPPLQQVENRVDHTLVLEYLENQGYPPTTRSCTRLANSY